MGVHVWFVLREDIMFLESDVECIDKVVIMENA